MIYGYFAYMYVCIALAEAIGYPPPPMKLELWIIVSHHVGDGNWKGSKCS